jgi:DNA-binding transcriptional LysR family regulator
LGAAIGNGYTVELRDLEIFQHLTRSPSMSQAAAALGVAQPTVSTRIRDLELELGVDLFARSARGVELTPAGEQFAAYVDRSLAVLAEGLSSLRRLGPRLRLRLAAPASVAEMLFAPLAAALVEHELDVQLTTQHSRQVVEMLLDGRLDAGLAGVVAHGEVRATPLKPIPIVCVAGADHALSASAPESYGLAEIAEEPLALFEWDREVEDLRERLVLARGRRLDRYEKVSPAAVARDLVLGAGAVSFLPERLVVSDLAAGRLVVLRPREAPSYVWRLHLLERPTRRSNQAVTRLREVLVTAGLLVGDDRSTG